MRSSPRSRIGEEIVAKDIAELQTFALHPMSLISKRFRTEEEAYLRDRHDKPNVLFNPSSQSVARFFISNQDACKKGGQSSSFARVASRRRNPHCSAPNSIPLPLSPNKNEENDHSSSSD